MVIPAGLEPATYRLGICRSILMSYGTTQFLYAGIHRRFPDIVCGGKTAGAGAIAQRLGLRPAGEEDPGVARHPPPGRAVKPPEDLQPPVAGETDMPVADHPV